MNLRLTLLLSAFAASTALTSPTFAIAQTTNVETPRSIVLAQKKDDDDKKARPGASAKKPDDAKKKDNARPQNDKRADDNKAKPRENAVQSKPTPDKKNAAQNRKDDKKDAKQDRKDDRKDARQDRKDDKKDARQDRKDDKKDARQDRKDDRKDAKQDRKDDNKDARQDRKDDKRSAGSDRKDDKNQERRAGGDDRKKKIEDVKRERKETKEGDRTVIKEDNRTIVKVNNTTIIRHDDTDRFRHGGGDVRVNRRGDRTETVIVRPGGVRIVNVVDDRGRLVRRSRWVNGREYVLIDNRYDRPGPGFGFVVQLPPPVVSIPRERYIVDYRIAPRPVLYETLVAPPVMALDRRFTLDEIRYNAVVRQRMPSIDIDSITFESGSWDVSPDQAGLLEPLAEAMSRAIAKNPAEVYLIGGHTDSVGDPEDNLSLSDRRAESVAEVLTSRFNIPPENLVTQGYGETNLRVDVQGPEPRNRYVSIRRITPLLKTAQQ